MDGWRFVGNSTTSLLGFFEVVERQQADTRHPEGGSHAVFDPSTWIAIFTDSAWIFSAFFDGMCTWPCRPSILVHNLHATLCGGRFIDRGWLVFASRYLRHATAGSRPSSCLSIAPVCAFLPAFRFPSTCPCDFGWKYLVGIALHVVHGTILHSLRHSLCGRSCVAPLLGLLLPSSWRDLEIMMCDG